jgi:hypothetical protein
VSPRSLIGAALMSLVLVDAHASDIQIGSAAISLGMDRKVVADRLQRYRVVQVVGDESTVAYYDGKALLGSVGYQGGKVKWASRNWGAFSDGEDSIAAGKAIMNALSTMAVRSGPQASVTTHTHRAPRYEARITEIRFPDRHLQITLQGFEGNTLYISEIVGRMP